MVAKELDVVDQLVHGEDDTAPVIVQEMTTRSFCEWAGSIEMQSLANFFETHPSIVQNHRSAT